MHIFAACVDVSPDIYISVEVGQVIRIIRVIWVTFCPGQVGLIHFTEYLGLTRMRSRVSIS